MLRALVDGAQPDDVHSQLSEVREFRGDPLDITYESAKKAERGHDQNGISFNSFAIRSVVQLTPSVSVAIAE